MRFALPLLLILLAYCSSHGGSPQRQRANNNQSPPTFAGLESATVNSNGTVTLSWTAASDAVTPASAMVYDICLGTTPGSCATNFTAHLSTTPGATVYSLTNLPAGAGYYVVVRARNEWGLRDSNAVEHAITIPGWFSYWGSATTDSERVKAVAASEDGYLMALELQTTSFTQAHYPLLGSLTPTVSYPGSSGGAKQTMLVKLNFAGEAEWFTFIGQNSGTSHETLGIARATDGFVVLLRANGPVTSMASTSPLNSYNNGNDFLLVKVSNNGNLAWFTFWGSNGDDYPQSLAIHPDGRIMAFGSSNTTTGTPVTGYSHQGDFDAVLVSFAANGAYQNHRYLGGAAGSQNAVALAVSQERIALGIYSDENFTVNMQNPLISHTFGSYAAAAIVVFDLNFSYQWHTFFGTSSGDVSLKALSFNGSELYFTATTGQNITSFASLSPLVGHQGGNDILTGKYNATGSLQWFTYAGSTSSENPIAVIPYSSNITIAGNCGANIPNLSSLEPRYSFGGAGDICLFQYNAAGQLQWYSFSSLSGGDSLYAIALGSAGNLLLAGSYSSAAPASQIDGINAMGAHNKSSGIPSGGLLLNFTPEGQIK